MSIFNIFKSNQSLTKKENPAGVAYAMMGLPSYNQSKTKKSFIQEGYIYNVVIYRAIREITEAASGLKIILKQGDKILDAHPALDLIHHPNPATGRAGFIKHALTDLNITGEIFISTAANDGKQPSELWIQNPVTMNVIPGKGGVPAAYESDLNGKKIQYPVDQLSGISEQMFMFKLYNPDNYWRGLPPLQPASLAGDVHNRGLEWNYGLLKNDARPSLVLKAKGVLSGDAVNRIREMFKTHYTGSSNSGTIPILSDGLDIEQMFVNAKDMDFLALMKEVSKYIASAFGVPLPLIDNDASTFNNLASAKERLYTDTVLPMVNQFLGAFGNWLLPRYGDNLSFCIVMDDIPALEGLRQLKFDRTIKAVQAGLLTPNEARMALGEEPINSDAADQLYISAGQMPIDLAGASLPPDEQALAKSLKGQGFSDLEIKEILNAPTKA